jgi:dolichyl-phosphate beta-glucosyltransferase
MLLYMPSLAIIIPCYNEEVRLKRVSIEKLVEGLDDATLIFVNDGSRDNTLAVLSDLAAQFPDRISIISFQKNEGKAKAIAKGVRQVIDTRSFVYIGYMDADFSTPVAEFIKLYTIIRGTEGLLCLRLEDQEIKFRYQQKGLQAYSRESYFHPYRSAF